MSEKLDPFRHMPGQAKKACEMLSALSAIWGLFLMLGIVTSVLIGLDGVRAGMIVYAGILSAGALTATIMLAKGRRAGQIVAWLVLPFFLIFFPIGTIIGIFAVKGLHSEEMKKYLANAESARRLGP